MATKYEFSGVVKDANDSPVAGATISVTPLPSFTLMDGTNIAETASVTTSADGTWSFQLYPSPIDKPTYVYSVSIGKGGVTLLEKLFRMPPAPASLWMQNPDQDNALVITPIGEVSQATIPLPTIDHPTLSDIDVTSASGGDWGAWTEVYAHQNVHDEDVFDTITGELTFNPTWGTTNPYAEIEVRVLHTESDKTTLVENVLPHLNTVFLSHLFSSPLTPHTESLSLAAANILAPNDYLIVSARIRRHGDTGTAQIMGAQSSLYISTIRKHNVSFIISPTSTGGALRFDTTEFEGDGTSTPVALRNPFTSALHTKLDGIEPHATADQTGSEIITEIIASPDSIPATKVTGLSTGNPPTTLDGLSDVEAPNPQDGDAILFEQSSQKYKPKPIPAEDPKKIATALETLPEPDQLKRSALTGETTVEIGTTLPDISTVAPGTIRAQQSSNADDPTLHIAGGQFAVPTVRRNEVELTLNNGNFRVADRNNGGTGSASDNFDNFIGFISTGTTVVTIAVYWGTISQSLQTNPGNHLFITTPATAFGATQFDLNAASDRYITISGRRYTQYHTTSSALATGLKAIGMSSTWEFHTNTLATADLNIKPATHETTDGQTWHGVGITGAERTKLASVTAGAEPNVKADFNATSGDAEILNKPTVPASLDDLSDVAISSPAQGESLSYDRASRTFVNLQVDHPTFANLDLVVNNISSASGDHLLTSYTWSDLQLTTIEFAVGHKVAYRLIIDTDQAFHSVKFRQTGSTGSFIGSTALPGIVSGTQTVTGKGMNASMLEPSLDIYLNRTTSTRATITRVRLFLYLYID